MITKHPNWKPSNRLFYKRYHTSIKLGYFSDNSKPTIPARFTDYRIVFRHVEIKNKHEIDCTVYTSDNELIETIMSDTFLERRIISIHGPVNDNQVEQMCKLDYKTVIRERKWYDAYRYKMTIWPYWKNIPSDEEYETIHRHIYTQFDRNSSRIVNSYGNPGFYSNHWTNNTVLYKPVIGQSLPTVYTNSAEQLFLFKLAYSNILTIYIETVITHDEFQTDK